MSLERHVCRLPLLCGRPCSTSSIRTCTQKNVESLFWFCHGEKSDVQCRKDPVNLFSSSQIHCGWWLHRILWAETELLWLSLSSRSHVVCFLGGRESVSWCFLGYNHLYGHRHIKLYSHLDDTIAQLIREIRSDYHYIPGFKKCDLECIVNYISTL